MTRTRRHARDKWAEALTIKPLPPVDEVTERLLDVALGRGPLTPGLAADAVGSIARLRTAIREALASDAMMGCEDIERLSEALEDSAGRSPVTGSRRGGAGRPAEETQEGA